MARKSEKIFSEFLKAKKLNGKDSTEIVNEENVDTKEEKKIEQVVKEKEIKETQNAVEAEIIENSKKDESIKNKELEVKVAEDEGVDEEIKIKNVSMQESMKLLYENPTYKKFKEDFLNNDDNKQLIIFLDIQRSKGIEIFSDDFYIYNKMLHNSLKLIILEPTLDDTILGKRESIFLVKQIYPKEYREFIQKYRSREANPDKFQDFILDKGVLYPEHKPEEDINNLYSSGEVISLFDVIINMSDLNKRYKVIEV